LQRQAGITISDYSETTSDFTVLSLNRRADELLSSAFPAPVWVRGEIAEVSRVNARGHTYFRLVEPSHDGMGQPLAVIDCALFAGNRPSIVRAFAREGQLFEVSEGMTIRISGRVTIWDKGGRYQLIVESIDPSWTMGDQAKKLRRLVDSLKQDGVLQANGELDMSPAPLNIGLITARDSAAEQDFLQSLIDSRFPFSIYAAYAPMQGKGTAQGVIDSFNRLLEVPELDAIVLTRGGGSSTDLAWFNDKHIALIISQVPWPVISAIGHETDTTLPDFAAHTAVKTPTQAADYLINRLADLTGNIDSLAAILHRSVSRGVAAAQEVLSARMAVLSRSGRLVFRAQRKEILTLQNWLVRSTRAAVSAASARLSRRGISLSKVLDAGNIQRFDRQINSLNRELASSLSRRFEIAHMRLKALETAAEASNPDKLYRKGWATVRTGNGELLRSISDTAAGEAILVTLRDGSLHARTERIFSERTDDE